MVYCNRVNRPELMSIIINSNLIAFLNGNTNFNELQVQKTPTLDNDVTNKLFVETADALLIPKTDITTTISGTPSDTKVASESAVASAVITRENILTTDLIITTSYQPLVLSESLSVGDNFLEFYFGGALEGALNKIFSESTKLRVVLGSTDEQQTHLIIDGIIVTINLLFDGPNLKNQTN